MNVKIILIGLALLIAGNSIAAEKTTIKIGVLAFGTVDWELSALEKDPKTASADFQLQVERLANPEAGKIALQSGAVDMIVTDWIWVSRMRANGADFTFYPYSSTSGALMVAKDSPIHSLKDLKGKRLGIAGGELDKNWLLLQALAQQEQLDLDKNVEKVFGAPPLLNEQLKQKRVDAVLNYWHFAARLEAEGYRQIINGKGILKALGITENAQKWGKKKLSYPVNHFLEASQQAKIRLCSDDAAWKEILPLTRAKDPETQAKLRQGYCDGRIEHWGEAEQQAAGRLYTLLRKLSSQQLTGTAENVQAGTFWVKD